MNIKLIWLMWVAVGFSFCIACEAQVDDSVVQTNLNWHIINAPSITRELVKQVTQSLPSNSMVWICYTSKGRVVWTTNGEEWWHDIWTEGTNGMRTQLKIATNNAASCVVHIQVGSFKLKRAVGSMYFETPNGKFAKFELNDSSGYILPPKATAGTNLLGDVSLSLLYQTHSLAWAVPSAGSLTADFPERASTNAWPRYYPGSGFGTAVNIYGHGDAKQINSLNLYDLYSITNAGDYTLTVQPVLYLQRFHDSEFLDRVDLPCVTTIVHLVPNVQQ